MRRDVALGDRQELVVREAVNGPGRGAPHEGVDQPDLVLPRPQRRQPQGVGVAFFGAGSPETPQAADDLEPAAIVADEVVAEADDEDRQRRYLSLTTCTEQEMQGS